MQWTLEQLRQFVLTADSGSFSEAARRLGRAQSAVSTAIAILEADLGLELFDRSRRNAQPTDAGALLLLEARELLRQAQSLDQRALSLSAGNEARLALALDEALPYSAVNTLVREIGQRYPDLELTLLNGTATEVAEYVEQQRAQMAIHFVRGPISARFDQRHIGTVAQGLFAPGGHALTQCQPVQRTDLARFRQLILHADDIDETAFSPKVWRSDSFYSLAQMVADDLGWAILPVHIATEESYRQPLQQLDCPALGLPRLSVRVLWCQGWQPGATAQWVLARFTQLLR